MKFASRVFNAAGIYGIIVLLPQYFLESKIGHDSPPPITHPEYFYGFVGVGLACQVLFLIIARDPVRFRPVMPVAMLEKFSFAAAAIVLYTAGRIAPSVLTFACIDLVLGALFMAAYRATPSASR